MGDLAQLVERIGRVRRRRREVGADDSERKIAFQIGAINHIAVEVSRHAWCLDGDVMSRHGRPKARVGFAQRADNEFLTLAQAGDSVMCPGAWAHSIRSSGGG